MIFDIAVVLVLIGAVALGAWKGFAWQLAAIGSLLAGFIVGIPLSKPLAPLFGASAPLNRFAALAVLYIAISLGVYLTALFYRKTIEHWQLHHWDHHLGGVLGAVKGFLLCMALTFFAVVLVDRLREPILRSHSGRLMGRTMLVLHPVLPPAVHDILHPYMHELDPVSPPAIPATAPAPAPDPERHHNH